MPEQELSKTYSMIRNSKPEANCMSDFENTRENPELQNFNCVVLMLNVRRTNTDGKSHQHTITYTWLTLMS